MERDVETVQVTTDIRLLSFPVGQAYIVRHQHGYALVDSGPAGFEAGVLAALTDFGARPLDGDLTDIVLTHAHSDHTGSAAALAAATGARVLAGAADAPAVRAGDPDRVPDLEPWEEPFRDRVLALHAELGLPPAPPATRVDRELADGDLLDWGDGARVLHVPGHTPGSVAVHLPSTGALFTGDTIAFMEGRPIPGAFNTDRRLLVDSIRRMTALDVETACFGHGEAIPTAAGTALRTALT